MMTTAKRAYEIIHDHSKEFRRVLDSYNISDEEYIKHLAEVYSEGAERRKGSAISQLFGDNLRIDITDKVKAYNKIHEDEESNLNFIRKETSFVYDKYMDALNLRMYEFYESENFNSFYFVGADNSKTELSEKVAKELNLKHHRVIKELISNQGYKNIFKEEVAVEGYTFPGPSRVSKLAMLNFDSFVTGKTEGNYWDSGVRLYDIGESSWWQAGLSVRIKGHYLGIVSGRRTYKTLRKTHKDIGKVLGREIEQELNGLLSDLESEIHKTKRDYAAGRVFLSIDPLDFLTMSTNNCNWSSCLGLDGSYSYGAVHAYTHPEMMVMYRTTKDCREYLPGIHDKVMRQIFFMTDEGIASGVAYPSSDTTTRDAVIEYLSDNFDTLMDANWSEDNVINVMYDDLRSSYNVNRTITGEDFYIQDIDARDYFGEYLGGGHGMFAFYGCSVCGRDEDWCDCEFCNYCGEHIDDCECDRCSNCGEVHEAHYSDCSCDRCESCEALTEECECSLCEECNEHEESCTCEE